MFIFVFISYNLSYVKFCFILKKCGECLFFTMVVQKIHKILHNLSKFYILFNNWAPRKNVEKKKDLYSRKTYRVELVRV